MPDYLAILTLIASMLQAIDDLNWKAARNSFTDTVEIDYTSLFGGEPARLSADQLIANWQGLVPGFDATQHITGGVVPQLEGDRGTARTTVRGYHYVKGAAGGEIWMVAGTYDFQLRRTADGWKIAGIKLTVSYQEGNLKLPTVAQERATKSPRRPKAAAAIK